MATPLGPPIPARAILKFQYTKDGGATIATPAGIPLDSNDVIVMADPFASATFYGVRTAPLGNEIYRSTDGGASWSMTGHAPTLEGNRKIDSDDCANVYDAMRMATTRSHRLYFGYPKGMATSDDGGATWDTKTYPQLTSTLMTHVTPMPDGSTIWIGTDNLGVFKSTDAGETIAPADGGQTWTLIGVAMSGAGAKGLAYINGSSLAFEPGDLGTFWIQSYVRDCEGNGMVLTTHGGVSFSNVPWTFATYSTVATTQAGMASSVTSNASVHPSASTPGSRPVQRGSRTRPKGV